MKPLTWKFSRPSGQYQFRAEHTEGDVTFTAIVATDSLYAEELAPAINEAVWVVSVVSRDSRQQLIDVDWMRPIERSTLPDAISRAEAHLRDAITPRASPGQHAHASELLAGERLCIPEDARTLRSDGDGFWIESWAFVPRVPVLADDVHDVCGVCDASDHKTDACPHDPAIVRDLGFGLDESVLPPVRGGGA